MRRPTSRPEIATVTTMVSGSLWMANLLHHNLGNESEGRNARPTCRPEIASVTTMVSGSLWMANLLHHNLENKSEGRSDAVTSTFTRSYRQSCGGCASVARLQPSRVRFVYFGLRVKRYRLYRNR